MRNPRRILPILAACGAMLIFLLPLIWMLRSSLLPDEEVITGIQSLKDLFPTGLYLQNFPDVLERVGFFRTAYVSLAFTGIIVAAGLFINSACGYAFARLSFPGNRVLFSVVVALIIIPFEALAVPLFLLIGVKWQLINTLPGLFLPYLAKAFNIFYMRQYFLSLPKELEEAARVEGASWFRIYLTVALPLAKPALITCAVIDFVTHWSEYLWPLLITNKPEYETIQIGLGHFYTLPPIQWGDIMAYSVMATIPMLLLFVFFQKYLTASLATSGIKG